MTWFLCPYDVVQKAGRPARVCSMERHIPAIPNEAGAVWKEYETLGNYTVVEVTAPTKLLDAIRADPDFTDLENRPAVLSKMQQLGFTAQERTALLADPAMAAEFLKQHRSEVRLTSDKTALVIGARKAPRGVS